MELEQINKEIQKLKNKGKVSDGYHSFDELYEHRIRLFLALVKLLQDYSTYDVWATRTHSDGSIWDGWFLVGIGKEKGSQITYHLPDKYIIECEEAGIQWLEKAPEYDGHTSEDVLERLKKL